MRLPSWDEFTTSFSNFDIKINEKISNFKDNHQLLDQAIKESIRYLPPPFNGIAENLYDRFEGDPTDKIKEVREILSTIFEQGQENYEKTAIRLDDILMAIKDVKKIISNNSAVDEMRIILTHSTTRIEDEVKKLKEIFNIKTDKIHEDILKNQLFLKEIVQKLGTGKDAIPFDEKVIPEKQRQTMKQLFLENEKLRSQLNIPEEVIREDLLKELSVSFFHAKDYELSLKLVEKVLSFKPDDLTALANKASILVIQKQYREGLKLAEQVLKRDQNYLSALVNKGIALRNLFRLEEAIQIYDKAIKIKPDHDVILSSKGVTLAYQGKYSEALIQYEKAIKINPNNPYIWSNKSMSLYNLNRIQEAFDCIKKALEIDPYFLEALGNKAFLFEKTGKKEKAVEIYHKILEINPNHIDALNNLGVVYLDNKDYTKALEYFERALEVFPEFLPAMCGKSVVLFSNDEVEKAEKIIDEVLKIHPNSEEGLFNKASILMKKSQFVGVKRFLRKLVSINPSWKEKIISYSLFSGLFTDPEFVKLLK